MEKIETLTLDDKPKKRRLKTWVKVVLGFVILLVIIFISFNFLLSPPSNKSMVIDFTIEDGMSVYKVGEKLKKQGIIRNYYAYKIYVRLNNVSTYKAGVYKLDKSLNTKDIVEILTGNYYKENGIKITFKEGLTVKDIAKTIAKNTNLSENKVLEKMSDEKYIDELINKYWFLTDDIKNENIYYPLEGYLFPDTYVFKYNVTEEVIINTMLDQTDKVFSKYKNKINNSSYSLNEFVSLASVVEKEGIYENDRKKIAAVFYNRLNANMSLGSDVTTYYAFKVDLGKRDLTKNEINTYNPYNTRGPLMEGKLPVGAISNFSESSLNAVLNPDNNDYYYFVADKSGKTHFTKTYEEHQKIIKELKEANNWIEF